MTNEEAIEMLDKWYGLFPSEAYEALDMAIEALKAQAAIQKTGKWWRRAWSIECSECGYDMPFAIRNYCPNCGAKMEEEQ